MALPIFTGGRTVAGVKEARAEYNATCAEYRQTVLVGFRDVSDAVNDLQSYKLETGSLDRAVKAAEATTDTSNRSFTQGLVNYLNVVDSERVQLEAETQRVQVMALERVATVHLYKALGGGFEVSGR